MLKMRGGVELEKNNHYSPLPQALSDDEEEEEVKPIHYRPNYAENISNFNNVDDHTVKKDALFTPLISAQMHETKTMSLSRKICFSLSILLSCTGVISFLWLLPCDIGFAYCQNHKSSNIDSNWQITIPSTVFSSGLQLVDADQDGRMDIILGFHRVTGNNSSIDMSPSFSAGLIVIRGYDGHKIWRQTYYSSLSDILCNVLDVNQDGVMDCILIGNLGLFSAINVSNDYTFWYLHDHMNARRPVNMSLPATVPDLTDDGIEDLIVSCHLNEDTKSDNKSPAFLIIISGGMGELCGNPVPLNNCILASKPISVSVNNTIFLLVHCEPDNEPGSVLMISLDQLKEAALDNSTNINSTSDEVIDSNKNNVITIHRFIGHGSHLHLFVADINGDGVADIIMMGGDGEVAVYDSFKFSFLWAYQKRSYDIISWLFGPKLEEKSKTLLLTLLPKNCNEDCSTIIVGICGRNGSEIWSFSNKSLTSPVILPSTETWQNLVAFKAYSKHATNDERDALNIVNATKYGGHWDETTADEKFKGSTGENPTLIAVNEKLLLLNEKYGIEEHMQHVITICYTYNKFVPECLPAFATRASGAIDDFDGDQFPDIISITTAIEVTSEEEIWNMKITKTSLSKIFNDTSSTQNIQISHLHSFE